MLTIITCRTPENIIRNVSKYSFQKGRQLWFPEILAVIISEMLVTIFSEMLAINTINLNVRKWRRMLADLILENVNNCNFRKC